MTGEGWHRLAGGLDVKGLARQMAQAFDADLRAEVFACSQVKCAVLTAKHRDEGTACR